ncbi:MAG: erythrose-4-phosphate dehydrogenase, partial [Colwelliaceae bacterium]|nr:erythrose-4-phosphate dehydrogenase [Colwelliaceae bacterium]
MSINIAINGFGRIGRSVARALFENGRQEEFNLVAINEPADAKGIAHLFKYDTTHGRFPFSVSHENDKLLVAGAEIALSHETSLEHL